MQNPLAFPADLVEATKQLTAGDPVMRQIVVAVGLCGLDPAWQQSPFESLVRAVAHQQLQRKAAAAILARFLALFPPPFPSPSDILGASDEQLRAAGFSRSKIAAIRDIAAKTALGLVPEREAADAMDDAELVQRLTTIRGVGQWTVEMLLIFTLGRLDVLPADDFGVRNGIRVAYGLTKLPTRRETMAMGERWRPFRSVASWYLWRVAAGT